MGTSELLLAFSAGLVAAVNPCGFALLPAYLSLLVLDGTAGRGTAVRRALGTSAVVTLGFTGVFLLFGLVVSPLASAAQRHLPWVTLAVGLALAAAGAWLLAGRRVPGLGLGIRGPRVRRGFVPVLLYGVAYAAASLTCTIAPFLAVVVVSFRAGSVDEGLLLFLAYALGMGALVTTASVAIALARTSVLHRLRAAGRVVPRIMGALLLLVGGYVAYYGAWELRVLAGAGADDPVIDAAARVQSWLSDAVDALGLWWLALLAAAVLGYVARRRTSRAG
jgi:cytochrome c-type biogenesis protein